MNKIRIAAVSYLNTKPLLYGLLNSPLANEIELSLDIPSECARKLRDGEVDLALAPVAILPELDQWELVSDYCIGTEGTVKTVNIYGEVPLHEMEAIYLDHHSKTSIALTKVLLKNHWHCQPDLLAAKEGYIQEIKGKTGGVVIGDRTIDLEGKHPYVYDLGQEWKQFTGLPFVFAAWVSRIKLPDDFILAFNTALKEGIEAIPKLKFLLPSPNPSFDLETYFTQHISYHLDDEKQAGLKLFLRLLNEVDVVVESH